jgi:hypothetical protein
MVVLECGTGVEAGAGAGAGVGAGAEEQELKRTQVLLGFDCESNSSQLLEQ